MKLIIQNPKLHSKFRFQITIPAWRSPPLAVLYQLKNYQLNNKRRATTRVYRHIHYWVHIALNNDHRLIDDQIDCAYVNDKKSSQKYVAPNLTSERKHRPTTFGAFKCKKKRPQIKLGINGMDKLMGIATKPMTTTVS